MQAIAYGQGLLFTAGEERSIKCWRAEDGATDSSPFEWRAVAQTKHPVRSPRRAPPAAALFFLFRSARLQCDRSA